MYCVRDTPIPKGNQIPGTPGGSSNSPPNSPSTIDASVSYASVRIVPFRAMRTAIATKSAIIVSRMECVMPAACVAAAAIAATERATADTSIQRHDRSRHRFRASAHAPTAGTHILLASRQRSGDSRGGARARRRGASTICSIRCSRRPPRSSPPKRFARLGSAWLRLAAGSSSIGPTLGSEGGAAWPTAATGARRGSSIDARPIGDSRRS